jgi:dTDP-4-dehydrorhamnose 3,5-epimerase
MIKELNISGCYHMSHDISKDNRGSFSRIACCEELKSVGIDFKMVQASIATNDRKGTIRGLHYQSYPNGENKIISCINGSAMLVVVDMRKDSPTYMITNCIIWGRSKYCEESIYVPKYCANGYQTIADNTSIVYMMDEPYKKDASLGINYLDERLGIQWLPMHVTISERDRELVHIWKE